MLSTAFASRCLMIDRCVSVNTMDGVMVTGPSSGIVGPRHLLLLVLCVLLLLLISTYCASAVAVAARSVALTEELLMLLLLWLVSLLLLCLSKPFNPLLLRIF